MTPPPPDFQCGLTRYIACEVPERLDVMHVPLEPRGGGVDATEPQGVRLTQHQGSVHLPLDDRVVHLKQVKNIKECQPKTAYHYKKPPKVNPNPVFVLYNTVHTFGRSKRGHKRWTPPLFGPNFLHYHASFWKKGQTGGWRPG